MRAGEAEAARAVEEALGVGAAEFVLRAVERNNREHGDRMAAAEGDPHHQGFNTKLYRSPAWRFVSELRGHPSFAGLKAWDALPKVEEILEPHGGWARLPDCDVWGNSADPQEAFIDAWMLQEDEGIDPLAVLVQAAEAVPLVERFPLESERWPKEAQATYRRAVAIAYWYARMLDQDGDFYIASRDLAPLLDVSFKQASKYLPRAAREGLLEEREEAIRGEGGQAARYRFDLAAVGFAGRAAETPQEGRTPPARHAVGEGRR